METNELSSFTKTQLYLSERMKLALQARKGLVGWSWSHTSLSPSSYCTDGLDQEG